MHLKAYRMCADAVTRVVAGSESTANSPGSSGNSKPLNAHHIERRRQKRKVLVKKLEKKLELYHRRIKK